MTIPPTLTQPHFQSSKQNELVVVNLSPQEGVSYKSCGQNRWQIPRHPAHCQASSQFLNLFPLISTERDHDKYLSMVEYIMS